MDVPATGNDDNVPHGEEGMGDGESNIPDDIQGDIPENMPSDDMDKSTVPADDDGDGGDNDIDSIVNQLSAEDRKAVRSYAQSMLDRSEKNDGNSMMESIVLKKRQIRGLSENFGPSEDELKMSFDERKPLNRKIKSVISKKSPFKNPDFE